MVEINSRTAEAIRQAVEKAVNATLEEHGLTVKTCTARYGEVTLNFTIKSEVADLPLEKTPAGKTFIQLAGLYNLDADMLGKEFDMPRKSGMVKYRITGLSSTRTKMPVDCLEVATGRTFQFTAPLVVKLLGKAA